MAILPDVLAENIAEEAPDRARMLEDIPKLMEILHERRLVYLRRRPTIVSIISASEIDSFCTTGSSVAVVYLRTP